MKKCKGLENLAASGEAPLRGVRLASQGEQLDEREAWLERLQERLEYARYRHRAASDAETSSPDEVRHRAAELAASGALITELLSLLSRAQSGQTGPPS